MLLRTGNPVTRLPTARTAASMVVVLIVVLCWVCVVSMACGCGCRKIAQHDPAHCYFPFWDKHVALVCCLLWKATMSSSAEKASSGGSSTAGGKKKASRVELKMDAKAPSIPLRKSIQICVCVCVCVCDCVCCFVSYSVFLLLFITISPMHDVAQCNSGTQS